MFGLICTLFSTKVSVSRDLKMLLHFHRPVSYELTNYECSPSSHGDIRKVCLLHWAEPCSKIRIEYFVAEDGTGWFIPCHDFQLHVLLNHL